jgi:hypothetical protein
MHGPGLVKARPKMGLPLGGAVVARKETRLWTIREPWIARLFAEADVLSEGATSDEPEGRVYYGSTSLRCELHAVRARIEGLPAGEIVAPTELAQALLADPSARLWAVRIARREAAARAGGALDVMHAELSARVTSSPEGVRLAIDVDVSARLARLHERVLRE